MVAAVADGLFNQERQAQKCYWTENATEATVEAMMLDSNASVIDKEERPEARAPSRTLHILRPVSARSLFRLARCSMEGECS